MTTSAPKPARESAGPGTLTQRDIQGLVFTADMYGLQVDQLAALLALTEQRARAIGAGWRARGYADIARLGPGKAWLWLTRAGLAASGLPFTSAPPALSRLAHIRAVTSIRLALESSATYRTAAACWRSERRLRARIGRVGVAEHIPDGEVHWPDSADVPYAGECWAIEAELTAKTVSRTASIMRELLTRTGDYGCPAAERLRPGAPPLHARALYLCSSAARPTVLRARAALGAAFEPRIEVRDLPPGAHLERQSSGSGRVRIPGRAPGSPGSRPPGRTPEITSGRPAGPAPGVPGGRPAGPAPGVPGGRPARWTPGVPGGRPAGPARAAKVITSYLGWMTLRAAGRALRVAAKVAAVTAACLAAAPATIVAGYAYALAWLLGWPPMRLYRAAAWCLPMLGVFLAAQVLRTGQWGDAWREPLRAWRQMWILAGNGSIGAGLVTAAPVAIPAGLLIGGFAWSCRVFSMETGTGGLTASSPITFDLRQWRHQVRTARARIAAPGAVPLIGRGGDVVAGSVIRTVQHPARSIARVPYQRLRSHQVVIGTTGTGKTTLLLRLWAGFVAVAWQRFAAGSGRRPLLVILDCKGGADSRQVADRVRRVLRSAGARTTAIWPDEARLSLWQLPPEQLTTTLLGLIEQGTGAAAYYADIMESVVSLAITAPCGPPAGSAGFLSRLDSGWLAMAYAADPAALAVIRSSAKQITDVALRFRALFRRLGTGLDGPGSFDDADVWYCILEGTAETAVAEAQAKALVEILAWYAARPGIPAGPAGRPAGGHGSAAGNARQDAEILLAVDEFSAVSRRVPIWQLYERARSLGLAVQVSAQSWQGLASEDDDRYRIAATADGGIWLLRTPFPDPVADLASSRRMVDTTRRLLGAALWTGDGYARAHHTQVVDPDIVRSLDVGQAAYIYRGGVTYVQVKRLLAGAAAVVAPAKERLATAASAASGANALGAWARRTGTAATAGTWQDAARRRAAARRGLRQGNLQVTRPDDPGRGVILTSSPRLKPGDSSGHPLGFLLRRRLPAPLTRLGSYTVSTGCHRQPGGQYVARCVDVPVVARIAAGARPFADVQRQHTELVPATGARLARREPAADHDQVAAVPLALVLQHAAQVRPGRVGYGAGQGMAADHVHHCEVLDHDRLVFTDQSSGEFVQMVAPAVGDPRVDTRDLDPRLRPVGRAFGLAGELPLRLGEPVPVPPLMPRVGDLLPGRERGQGGDARVDADGTGYRAERPDRGLHQDRHEPPARAVPADGDSGRFRAPGQRARPHDRERRVHLGEPQMPVAPPERGPGVLRRRAGMLPRLEPGVLRPLVPERRERALQMAQRLLQRHAGHLTQVGEVAGPFPLGEQRRRLHVADPFLPPVPRRGTGVQRQVIDLPDAAERPPKLPSLCASRVEAVLVRPLDLPRHASHSTLQPCERRHARSSPRLNTGVSRAHF